MAEWKPVGVVFETEPVLVEGLNAWDHKWVPTGEPAIRLPHPSHPRQVNQMWVYQIESEGKKIRFAAGEVSANVWAFYVPA